MLCFDDILKKSNRSFVPLNVRFKNRNPLLFMLIKNIIVIVLLYLLVKNLLLIKTILFAFQIA